MDWSLRLGAEYETCKSAWFITLTYKNEYLPTILKDRPIIRRHFNIPDKETLCKRDLQLFLKRLRQANGKKSASQMRYYACGEYGSRYGRPHYHILAFNLVDTVVERMGHFWTDRKNRSNKYELKGIVHAEPVRSVKDVTNYVANYIVGAYANPKRLNERPFSLMSRRPYLGHQYVKKMLPYHRKLQEPFLYIGASRVQRLPRLFKKKIFSETELEKFKIDATYNGWLQREKEMEEYARLFRKENPGSSGYSYALGQWYERRKYWNDYILANTKQNDKF